LEFNVPFQHKYGYIRDDVISQTIDNGPMYVVSSYVLVVGMQIKKPLCDDILITVIEFG